MKNQWFKKSGWIYFPVSIMGWIISALALAFCVNVFWVIDTNSHSVSDTFYNVFPYFVCTLLLVNWIAGNTSIAEDKKAEPAS